MSASTLVFTMILLLITVIVPILLLTIKNHYMVFFQETLITIPTAAWEPNSVIAFPTVRTELQRLTEKPLLSFSEVHALLTE